MNQAHLHMVFNHFPIIGLFFGIGILLYGIIKKKTILMNTAYVLFVFCMIMAKATIMTGEGAEEIVEQLVIDDDLIHQHEELAETFMKVLYGLGVVSLFGLFTNFKNHARASIVSYVVFLLAIGSAVLSVSVGTSGGEIRHTEIRNQAENSVDSNSHAEEED